jgi:hypothetical protein
VNKLNQSGMTFLIIVPNWWGTETDLPHLKKRASREGHWNKGEKRIYKGFLVQKDTVIEGGKIAFTSDLAAETAIDLGFI